MLALDDVLQIVAPHPARPSNEAIPSSSECLDNNGRVRRFAQRIAQPLDGCIQAMIEVDEGVRGPELASQFLSGDDFSWPFKQHGQHLKGFFLYRWRSSPALEIDLERTETDDSG
jgi:hypothetical protein